MPGNVNNSRPVFDVGKPIYAKDLNTVAKQASRTTIGPGTFQSGGLNLQRPTKGGGSGSTTVVVNFFRAKSTGSAIPAEGDAEDECGEIEIQKMGKYGPVGEPFTVKWNYADDCPANIPGWAFETVEVSEDDPGDSGSGSGSSGEDRAVWFVNAGCSPIVVTGGGSS